MEHASGARLLIQQMLENNVISKHILMASLMFARITPITFLTPFLGGKLVPAQTRMGLSVGLTILSFPFVKSYMDGPIDIDALDYVVLMLKEVFIGYVIGFVASELFFAMEVGGRAVDIMRGSNMAEVQVPELKFRVSPIGQFGFQLLLVVFCALNGHGFFIEGVIDSFRIVPIDAWPTLSRGLMAVVDQVLRYTDGLFKIAFALVFPGMFAAFVVDVMFGMFNRIAPQLNAYFMAMGVKAMGGIAMFMFALTLMTGEMAHWLEHALIFLRKLVALFG